MLYIYSFSYSTAPLVFLALFLDFGVSIIGRTNKFDKSWLGLIIQSVKSQFANFLLSLKIVSFQQSAQRHFLLTGSFGAGPDFCLGISMYFISKRVKFSLWENVLSKTAMKLMQSSHHFYL